MKATCASVTQFILPVGLLDHVEITCATDSGGLGVGIISARRDCGQVGQLPWAQQAERTSEAGLREPLPPRAP